MTFTCGIEFILNNHSKSLNNLKMLLTLSIYKVINYEKECI